MTKFILILSFILQAVLAYSQYKVIDQDSKLPIPYAHIKNTAKNSSLITNFNGEFSMASTYNNIDSLRITCIGFKDKFVTVATLKQNHVIELAPLAKQFDEVIVSAKKDKYQTKKLGVTRNQKPCLLIIPLRAAMVMNRQLGYLLNTQSPVD